MQTPAQKAGFEIGKKYRITSGYPDDHDFHVGTVVSFTKDDGSTCPRFEGENDAGDGYNYPYLHNIDPTPVEDGGSEQSQQAVQAVDYHVSVNPNSTTIVIQKRLSIEEIQAVLKAAGV